ncbi:MAG: BcsR/BcsP family cellulose biosynthesis protein [Gallionella sp.]|jgi:hypothetical protein
MKKSANVDISNLFKKFGGDTGSYKEIQQDYIGEKAQKNWPIVQAVEKERAVAPRLKMAVSGSGVAQPAPPVSRHVAHHHVTGAQTVANPAASALFGGLNAPQAAPAAPSLFSGLNGSQAEPVAPVRSLFGAINTTQPVAAPVRSLFNTLSGAAAPAEATAAPVRSLFSSLTAQPVAAQPAAAQPARVEPVQVRRNENDALGAVFSRLLNQQKPETAPDQNLRSMLGFLTK